MLKKNLLTLGWLLLLIGAMLAGYALLTSLTNGGLMEISLLFWFAMPVIYFGLGLLIIKHQFGNPYDKQDKPELHAVSETKIEVNSDLTNEQQVEDKNLNESENK